MLLSFAFVSFGCDSDKKSSTDAAVDTISSSDVLNAEVTPVPGSDSGSVETGSAETAKADALVSEDGGAVVAKDAPAPSLDTAADHAAGDSSVD